MEEWFKVLGVETQMEMIVKNMETVVVWLFERGTLQET